MTPVNNGLLRLDERVNQHFTGQKVNGGNLHNLALAVPDAHHLAVQDDGLRFGTELSAFGVGMYLSSAWAISVVKGPRCGSTKR